MKSSPSAARNNHRSDKTDPNETGITYAYPEEIDFLLCYASRANDVLVHDILSRGFMTNAEEAAHLARFFWHIVDPGVEDAGQKAQLPWPDAAGFWNEKIMRSISGYLERVGYDAAWERVSDEQD